MQPTIDAFAAEHLRALGLPYAVCGGRDGQAIKRLPPEYTVAKLQLGVRRYFADPWTRRTAASVPRMVDRLPVLLAHDPANGPPLPAQPKTWRDRAMEADMAAGQVEHKAIERTPEERQALGERMRQEYEELKARERRERVGK